MTTPERARIDRRWGRALAAVLLYAAAALAWWPVFGATLLRAAPVVAIAALLVARAVPQRAGIVAAALWLPVALVLAGVPVAGLKPPAWGSTAESLVDGLVGLTVPGRGPVEGDPWPLAAVLLLGGFAFLTAGASGRLVDGVAGTRAGRAFSGMAFLFLVLPLVAAIALQQSEEAAWQGAVLLTAGMLWVARGRFVAVLAPTIAVGAVAILGAQTFGPEDRWVAFGDILPRDPAFTELNTSQTYGPLGDRRTGATMLEITSPKPALWRMQVLQRFDRRVWDVTRFDDEPLPQPAAKRVTTKVTVRGLENDLVAAPGRVVRVTGAVTEDEDGEARELEPRPRPGTTYTVESEVVEATTKQLSTVPISLSPRYDRYTSLWQIRSTTQATERPTAAYADRMPPQYAGSPWGRVLTLARSLSKGETSQLEVVRSVQRYLQDPKRFTYTTDVPEAGFQPILDFLLETRAGYCQHYAGAAALLLRLAGVPTRVVAGFATGSASGGDRYTVKDQDAHAWIEVYFPGYGWVPFNPTPPAAEASVAAELDLLAPQASGAGSGGAAGGILAAVFALIAGGGLVMRRRLRRTTGAAARHDRSTAHLSDLLARLAPGGASPGVTLAALRPDLEAIGPRVAALGSEVEQQRFGAAAEPLDGSPRLLVWRALVGDLGAIGAARLVASRIGGTGARDVLEPRAGA